MLSFTTIHPRQHYHEVWTSTTTYNSRLLKRIRWEGERHIDEHVKLSILTEA